MGLSTYQELKASLTNQSRGWTKRGDVLSLADDFIDLTESRMYSYGETPLRIREMEITDTAVTSTTVRTLALPARFVELRRMHIEIAGIDPLKIDYVTPLAMKVNGYQAMPKYVTVKDTFEFDSVSDQAYTVEYAYYQTLLPLDNTNDTNAILTKYPGIYLYGCLWACAEWALQGERAVSYQQKFMIEIAAANRLDLKGRYGPAPVIARQGRVP